MATLDPKDEERLKKEYGDIFGGLLTSSVTPVAYSEFTKIAHEPRYGSTLTPEELAEITAGIDPDDKWDRWATEGIPSPDTPIRDYDPRTGTTIISPTPTADVPPIDKIGFMEDLIEAEVADESARPGRTYIESLDKDPSAMMRAIDDMVKDPTAIGILPTEEGTFPFGTEDLGRPALPTIEASMDDASIFLPKFGDPGVAVAEDAYWEDLIARGLPTETTPDPTPLIDAVSGKTYLSPSDKLAMGIYGTPDAEMRSDTAPLYRDTFVEDIIESPFGALIPAGRSAMEGKSPAEWSGMDYVDLGLTAAGWPAAKAITKFAETPVAGFVRSEWDKLREILKPTAYTDKATDASKAKGEIDRAWGESRFADEDPLSVRREITSDGRLLGDYPMGPSLLGDKIPTTAKMDVLGYLDEIPTGIYDASDLARIKAAAAAKAGMTVPEFTVMFDRIKPAGELGLDDYIINTAKVPASVSESVARIYGAGLKPTGVARELITSPTAKGIAAGATLAGLGYSDDPEAAETPIIPVDDFSDMRIPSQGSLPYARDPRKPGLSYDYSGYHGIPKRITWNWPDGTTEVITEEQANDPSAYLRSGNYSGKAPDDRTPVKTLAEIEKEYDFTGSYAGGPSRTITRIDATGGLLSPFGGVGDYTTPGGFYTPITPLTGITPPTFSSDFWDPSTAPVDPLAAVWT